MKYTIINPHDPYTMEAASHAAALGAIAVLGEGMYGVRCEGFEAGVLTGSRTGDWREATYREAGIDPPDAAGLCQWMGDCSWIWKERPENNEAVAKALESIRCDGEKSSTVDLEAKGKRLAQAMRGKRTFKSVEKKP